MRAAASRIYVHRSKFRQLADGLAGVAQSMKLGAGLDTTAQINPLVSAHHRDKVVQHIEGARRAGLTFLAGGTPADDLPGYYVKPAVIADPHPDSAIVRDEVFGPVIVVVPFDDAADAVRLANASPYGLAASLWSNDLTRVMNLVPQIEAGTVWVNCHIPLDPSMPFGGYKQSGIGREFGQYAIEGFTETKSVCIAHRRAASTSTDPTVETAMSYNEAKFWHPMLHPNEMKQRKSIRIVRGDGCYVFDEQGRKLVDGVAGLWNVNVGHNRQEVKDAIVRQLDGFRILPAVRRHFASARGGAVEEGDRHARTGRDAPRAVQLGRLRLDRDRAEDRAPVLESARPGRPHEVHLAEAGLSRHALRRCVGERQHGVPPQLRAEPAGLLPRRDAVAVPQPVHAGSRSTRPDLRGDVGTRDPVPEPDTVAAFIAEPIQGAGGVIVPPANYWPLVREVCDRYGVLLIADEVVTGFGRSGSMFGSRGWGVRPDIMCLAKGISSGYVPLGATVVNARIEDAFAANADFGGAIMHGYTYAGHPVACAAAIASLDIVVKEDLPANAAKQGAYLLEALKPFAERFAAVGEVRGRG